MPKHFPNKSPGGSKRKREKTPPIRSSPRVTRRLPPVRKVLIDNTQQEECEVIVIEITEQNDPQCSRRVVPKNTVPLQQQAQSSEGQPKEEEPDPVNLVRQYENDERLARALQQAQRWDIITQMGPHNSGDDLNGMNAGTSTVPPVGQSSSQPVNNNRVSSTESLMKFQWQSSLASFLYLQQMRRYNMPPQMDPQTSGNDTSGMNDGEIYPCGQEIQEICPCGQEIHETRPCGQEIHETRPCGQELYEIRPCGPEMYVIRPRDQEIHEILNRGQEIHEIRPCGQEIHETRPSGQEIYETRGPRFETQPLPQTDPIQISLQYEIDERLARALQNQDIRGVSSWMSPLISGTSTVKPLVGPSFCPPVKPNPVSSQAAEDRGGKFGEKIQLKAAEKVQEKKSKEIKAEARSDDRLVCKICMDKMGDVVFIPCGHLAACQACAESLSKCPVCRCKISKYMKIFIT